MKRIKKEHKNEIMERIKEAGDSNNYETSWDDKGIPISKKKSEIKKGRRSRAAGSRFELKVRQDLESKGRIVDKWTNNVDLEEGKIITAKRKYNPFKKMLVVGTGFPDFVTIKHVHDELYSVIGVEVKMNGILLKEEKEKCAWYLQKQIFSQIWIAKKGKKRGEIEYINFVEKYNKTQ
jgi:F0F1-type ATP synthase alpha subunit